ALDVGAVCGGRAELVHLHRVVDDEVCGAERVDARGVATAARHGAAHGGEVDHRVHSGEVLQQDARRHERPLLVCLGADAPGGGSTPTPAFAAGVRPNASVPPGHLTGWPAVPAGQGLDVALLDVGLAAVTQQVLQQDAHRHRQPRGVADPLLVEPGQPVVLDAVDAGQ